MNVLVPPWAPTHFAGKRIVSRWPYEMPGELVVANGMSGQTFPDATFMTNIDKPMEVWGVHFEIYPLDDTDPTPVAINPTLAAQFQAELAHLVKVSLTYISLDQKISKAKTRVSSLVDRNTGEWTWAPEPNTIVRSQGYEIEIDNLAPSPTFPTGSFGEIASQAVGSLLVIVKFKGFLLVLEGSDAAQKQPGNGTPTLPPTG